MEENKDTKKEQAIVVPKQLAKSLNDILGTKSKSTSGLQDFFDMIRPIVERGHERYKQQIISKQEYLRQTLKYLEQFQTTEEKLLAVQNQITKIDATISEETIRNYTGNVKYYLSIRNDILMPIKNNLKEEVEIRKLLPSVAPAMVTIEKRVRAQQVKKTKLDIDSAISKKVIDHLIGLKKFLEGDRPSLINAFYCQDVPKKIIWFGNANVWVTILYELKVSHKIKSSKKELSNWIVKYFSYKGKSGICDFDFESVYQTLNKSHVTRRVHPTNANYIEIMSLFD